jgi:hypothetical protein
MIFQWWLRFLNFLIDNGKSDRTPFPLRDLQDYSTSPTVTGSNFQKLDAKPENSVTRCKLMLVLHNDKVEGVPNQ